MNLGRRSCVQAKVRWSAIFVVAGLIGCPPPAAEPQREPAREPEPEAVSEPVHRSGSASAEASGPEPDSPVVILVVLKSFPDELVDAVEDELEAKLGVEVQRHGVVPLPNEAYYPKRRRYRADRLLDHLDTLAPPGAPHTTKVLGLTEVDISTTKEPYEDWGIFGLGALDDRSAVISSYRLRRKAKPAKVRFRVTTTAMHEVGHTFGLPHCTEPRCVMLDAEGGITNTDTNSGELGPACRAKFDAAIAG